MCPVKMFLQQERVYSNGIRNLNQACDAAASHAVLRHPGGKIMPAKLVAIGDSLTQGFASGAIYNTDLSYPAIIADCMGLDVSMFRRPNFRGSGGLPCNIEWVARRLEEKFGPNISMFEWLRAIPSIQDTLDDIEDYWERGRGTAAEKHVLYHNAAVWGFEVGDAFRITPAMCRMRFAGTKDEFLAIPSEARARTAYRVLNPSRDAKYDKMTQLGVINGIKEAEGGIDNLIVFLGANNCLATVLELRVAEAPINEQPEAFSNYTLWHPAHFEKDYHELVKHLEKLEAKNVFVATVPHVTIPPITRGIMSHRGRLPEGEKYFDYYTRFWIKDKDFDPNGDPHLKKAEAQHIDECIDKYNACIKDAVAAHANWHLVDICDVLDRLAVRRNHGRPTYTLPDEISDLGVRFFELDPGRTVKESSGLISLDGVHPTTCGYGIVAHEFMEVMKKADVVLAERMKPINWSQLRKIDTLVSAPPYTLDDMFDALTTLEKFFHFSRWYAKNPETPILTPAMKAVLGNA